MGSCAPGGRGRSRLYEDPHLPRLDEEPLPRPGHEGLELLSRRLDLDGPPLVVFHLQSHDGPRARHVAERGPEAVAAVLAHEHEVVGPGEALGRAGRLFRVVRVVDREGPEVCAARLDPPAKDVVSTVMRVSRPSNAPSCARRRRHENENVSTHWRSPLSGGGTRSIRFAAVAHIRRPVHDGQEPRPLQLNATSRLSPQSSHKSCAKRQRSPQSR